MGKDLKLKQISARWWCYVGWIGVWEKQNEITFSDEDSFLDSVLRDAEGDDLEGETESLDSVDVQKKMHFLFIYFIFLVLYHSVIFYNLQESE